ncbi:SDR family NAD(P)-dependent oxidoreductase [Micromonospora sp. NPDC005206]|uniref:SDR family NAD(P)-dependent oxidoreductase n=1 Tax=Micromonospora sp. NPDC005206 TaxID=3157022 RepID=UPI0033B37B74
MANILITGAGSGLGRGAALGLAQAGHHVIASAEIWSQVRDLRSEAQRQGVHLDAAKLDVTDEIDRKHAFGYDQSGGNSEFDQPPARRAGSDDQASVGA